MNAGQLKRRIALSGRFDISVSAGAENVRCAGFKNTQRFMGRSMGNQRVLNHTATPTAQEGAVTDERERWIDKQLSLRIRKRDGGAIFKDIDTLGQLLRDAISFADRQHEERVRALERIANEANLMVEYGLNSEPLRLNPSPVRYQSLVKALKHGGYGAGSVREPKE